ncbi:helix-hairpin-helix domain-containing protein [Streptomyces sp. NPDC020489]|uniref:helix-hairpin-helix domain-containing protein n=1 Tax=Streptomyces sp. NPDC020489 TaxID=3365077 RepID=UPI003792C057
MALRSRSRTATLTSGPGRGPASDVRARHRRRSRVRHRHASAEELRRRAEAMFGDCAGERGGGAGSGVGPDAGVDSAVESGSGAGGVRAPDGCVGVVDAGAGALVGARVGVDAESVRAGVDAEGARAGTDADGVREVWADGHSGAPAVADAGVGAGEWRVRAGMALRERLPVWVQTRCGLERRSVVALAVLLVVAAGFAVQHFWTGRAQSVRAPEVVAAPYAERGAEAEAGPGPGAPSTAGTPSAEIVVDVSGKVREPGVHRLPMGSRVADALRAAGGVRPGADTAGLNRARFLVDGEQVVVGAPAAAPGVGAGSGGTAASGPAGAVPGAGPVAPVSLNTATVDQLDTLPGVGPVLAQHIVDYRTQHGGFRSVDELREVNGIGERRFADLRNLVRP